VVHRVVLSDTEVLSEEDDVPLQRRTKQFRSGGSTVNGPQLLGSRHLGLLPRHSLTRWRC
jgi:hypothetical protein